MADLLYWDSDAFLGWLKEEPDKVNECREVLEEAEARKLLIVTSALTLVEVVKLKHRPRIEKEHAEKIQEFFKQEFISVRNVDRYVAEYARDLLWDYEFLKPKDSIHVATATRYKIPIIHTFDKDLIRLNGKIGSPPLQITRPSVSEPRLTGFYDALPKNATKNTNKR